MATLDPTASEPILTLQGVSVQFGGVRALSGVDLALRRGELLGLIGPNGAGKTTLLNLISGAMAPTAGTIRFNGRSIVGLSPDRLCHLGISRTFQNIRLFPKMTVFENVALGLHARPHYSLADALFCTPRALRHEARTVERVHALLDRVGLMAAKDKHAGDLPYGMQRRLELVRAMATDPQLLLLDEPAAGMNEDECEQLTRLIRSIHEEFGYSIILIEHHIKVVMELCRTHRIYVLNLGEILASGTPREIQGDPNVITAYLGEKRESHGRTRRQLSRSR
jgi:branched-chain amino acid transport system ATP-binding protein